MAAPVVAAASATAAVAPKHARAAQLQAWVSAPDAAHRLVLN